MVIEELKDKEKWIASKNAPLFIYSATKLVENLKKMKSLWPVSPHIYASIKCNPNKHLLQIIDKDLYGYDISSLEELKLLEQMKVSSERISISGPAKTNQFIREAMEYKVSTIHFDSLEEIKECFKYDLKNTNITLRISPAGWSTKLGMNEAEIEEAVEYCQKKNKQFSGLHLYLGKESFSAEKINNGLELAQKIFNKFSTSFQNKKIFLGAGFPGLAQEEFIKEEIKKVIIPASVDVNDIYLECGRVLFESAGSYLAPVLSVKKSGRPRPVVIIDGGSQHFAEKLLSETGEEEKYRPSVILRNETSELSPVYLTGNLCQDRDVLHPSCLLDKNVARGDWLVFPHRGAYGLTASNNQFIGMNKAHEWLIEFDGTMTLVDPPLWKTYHSSFLGNDEK